MSEERRRAVEALKQERDDALQRNQALHSEVTALRKQVASVSSAENDQLRQEVGRLSSELAVLQQSHECKLSFVPPQPL